MVSSPSQDTVHNDFDEVARKRVLLALNLTRYEKVRRGLFLLWGSWRYISLILSIYKRSEVITTSYRSLLFKINLRTIVFLVFEEILSLSHETALLFPITNQIMIYQRLLFIYNDFQFIFFLLFSNSFSNKNKKKFALLHEHLNTLPTFFFFFYI